MAFMPVHQDIMFWRNGLMNRGRSPFSGPEFAPLFLMRSRPALHCRAAYCRRSACVSQSNTASMRAGVMLRCGR